jgi:hypothetical protein
MGNVPRNVTDIAIETRIFRDLAVRIAKAVRKATQLSLIIEAFNISIQLDRLNASKA